MPTQHDIFISHSHGDNALANRIAERPFVEGCDLSRDRILCQSMESLKWQTDLDFIHFLRGKVESVKLVVLVLTERYFAHSFCLCELGALFAMGMPVFPLIVPPFEREILTKTLRRSLTGGLLDGHHLDDLRDAIKTHLASEAEMPRWDIKREGFLHEAPKIIETLVEPHTVYRSQSDSVKADYHEALKEMCAKGERIEKLKEDVENLRYELTETKPNYLCQRASEALGELCSMTQQLLYHGEGLEAEYLSNPDDCDLIEEALVRKEIIDGNEIFDPVPVNPENPRVKAAIDAIAKLRRFLLTLPNDDPFCREEQKETFRTISLSDRDFWDYYLF